MSKFDRQIATAARLIKKYGGLSIWHKHTVTENPAKPWKTASGAPATYSVYIAYLPFSSTRFSEALVELMAGTSVPIGTQVAYLAGDAPFTPEITDTVEINGELRQLKTVDKLAPDGVTPVLYTLTFA